MADLTGPQRDMLPNSAFGLPAERKYPMHDAAHAADAKGRAAAQLATGNLSAADHAKIVSKANRILARGKLTKAKPKAAAKPKPGASTPTDPDKDGDNDMAGPDPDAAMDAAQASDGATEGM